MTCPTLHVSSGAKFVGTCSFREPPQVAAQSAAVNSVTCHLSLWGAGGPGKGTSSTSLVLNLRELQWVCLNQNKCGFSIHHVLQYGAVLVKLNMHQEFEGFALFSLPPSHWRYHWCFVEALRLCVVELGAVQPSKVGKVWKAVGVMWWRSHLSRFGVARSCTLSGAA